MASKYMYIYHKICVLDGQWKFCNTCLYLNTQSIYIDDLCLNLNIKCNFKLKLIFDGLSFYTIGLFAIF